MKIMVVAGSAREKSNTRGLAQTIATHLEQLGTDVLFF